MSEGKKPTPKRARKKPEAAATVKPESTLQSGVRDTRWQPGQSGNPGGRPKVVGEIRDLARSYTRSAFATLLTVCRNKEAPPAARVAAAAHILDRGYGKPTQHVTATVRNINQMTDDELFAFLEGSDEADGSEGIAAPASDQGKPH